MGAQGCSAYNSLAQELATLSSFGVICYGRDWDLISTLADAAIVHDDTHRGYGITRKGWGIDTFRVQRFKTKFRFKPQDVRRLMDELGFPGGGYWVTKSRSRFTREEAFLLYLRRLSYPATLENLADEGFSAQPGSLSELYKMVDKWIFENHTRRLLQTGLTKWATRIPMYARAVQRYTGINPHDDHIFRCFGFIDGTSRAVSRPGYFQRYFYSGHKRTHCLQFLSVTAPDGMILFTHGPTNGAHQDNFMLHESKLATDMIPNVCDILGRTYCVYGDPIFARSDHVQKAFPLVEITAQQRMFNLAMNSARVSVEHIFGRVTSLWAWLDFKRTHKLHYTSPARTYLNAQFLTNVHNIFYPNKTSLQFGVQPPTLDAYLAMEEL